MKADSFLFHFNRYSGLLKQSKALSDATGTRSCERASLLTSRKQTLGLEETNQWLQAVTKTVNKNKLKTMHE